VSEEEKKEMIELITPQKTDKDYEEEIERLHSIIKEAKEYIEHNYFVVGRIEKIYKILDKENK